MRRETETIAYASMMEPADVSGPSMRCQATSGPQVAGFVIRELARVLYDGTDLWSAYLAGRELVNARGAH